MYIQWRSLFGYYTKESLVVRNVRNLYYNQAGVLIVWRLTISTKNVIRTRLAITAIQGIINWYVIKPKVKRTRAPVKLLGIRRTVNPLAEPQLPLLLLLPLAPSRISILPCYKLPELWHIVTLMDPVYLCECCLITAVSCLTLLINYKPSCSSSQSK